MGKIVGLVIEEKKEKPAKEKPAKEKGAKPDDGQQK